MDKRGDFVVVVFFCSDGSQLSLYRKQWLKVVIVSVFVHTDDNDWLKLMTVVSVQTAASSPWTEELRVAVPGKVHDEVNGYIALENIRAWVAKATLTPHDHFMFFIG